MSSEFLHEAAEKLSPATIDRHRATVSLMEELEAIDWYDQRIDAATDETLKAVLRHNRDEEKEHAAMVLEWLRRQDPVIDDQLRTYLFKEGDITAAEEAAEAEEAAGPQDPSDGCLGIGDLRREEVAP
ncbi:MAG TPA: ferritin-like domain-containing protein [Dongiaceae bacterium]|nr:ferritin-like domain-containing protein [Dongiaceae bacterium]